MYTCTRLEVRCLPTTSSVPRRRIDPGTYRSRGEHSTTDPRTSQLDLLIEQTAKRYPLWHYGLYRNLCIDKKKDKDTTFPFGDLGVGWNPHSFWLENFTIKSWGFLVILRAATPPPPLSWVSAHKSSNERLRSFQKFLDPPMISLIIRLIRSLSHLQTDEKHRYNRGGGCFLRRTGLFLFQSTDKWRVNMILFKNFIDLICEWIAIIFISHNNLSYTYSLLVAFNLLLL